MLFLAALLREGVTMTTTRGGAAAPLDLIPTASRARVSDHPASVDPVPLVHGAAAVPA